MASSVPTAETFTLRAQGTQGQLVRGLEKVAWELRESTSPWLPGGTGSSAGPKAKRSIPAKWEARMVGGNPAEPRQSLARPPSSHPDRAEVPVGRHPSVSGVFCISMS